MDNKPYFTIILPTYNRINYLKEAINSVRKQTFTNWILHVVDNSSNDGTSDYLCELIKQEQRIKFSTINNNGIIAVSRNFGLKKVNTKAVSFLDDDDIWFENKLTEDFSILKSQDCLTYSRFYIFSDKKKIIKSLPIRDIPKINPIYDLLHYGNIFTTSSVSYVINAFTKDILFDESINYRTWEDYDFWIKLIQIGKLKPVNTKKYGGKYRISDYQNSSYSQDILNNKTISFHYKKKYELYNLVTIDGSPLWCHYSNISSYIFNNCFRKSIISLVNACIISLITFDFLFFIKSITKFIFLFLKTLKSR
tara:strand:- start:891 stop:1814 length:924 start_codon:yes stop_codon:yes gene_type:complete